ncbi:MAG: hypothetical protein RLZZ258_803 [Actinomycetota bacterium]
MRLSPDALQAFTEKSKDSVNSNFEAYLDELQQLARIPGIAWSAFDPAELERSAEAVAKLLAGTEVFDSVEILRSHANGVPGAPAVVAQRMAKAGRPQILLYAHHDVQPPGDEQAWQTPAFEPHRTSDRIFGRGVADDKAGILAHLAAIRALKQVAGEDFDLGITVFVEGEEEAGSPTFRNFLDENSELLKADVIIVADSGNWSTEVPALTTTLRGLVSQVIEVSTLDHALHSGMYGGAVPDAMMALIKVLASLHDDQGNLAIAGLAEYEADRLDYSEGDLRRDTGLLPGVSAIGNGDYLERIWAKPALTVIGIDGQSVAMSSNTLLPKASAKISLRIAPGQEPEAALAILREHIETHLPFGAKVTFGEIELGKPFNMDASGWAAELAADALQGAWGVPSVNIGIGGSIPFIADLKEVFPAAQILVTGVEDPDSRAHSPNESVHIESLRKAMISEAVFLLAGNELKAN